MQIFRPSEGQGVPSVDAGQGRKDMAPSVTFVPDSHGVAIVSLPVDARLTNTVAVSIERKAAVRRRPANPCSSCRSTSLTEGVVTRVERISVAT